uniref:Uncharacterized protein n=1 Tax=Panagrolaimus superbus TaxID=310955 RepID=A0A914YSP0_9BILA
MFRGLLSASNLVDSQTGQLSHILLDLFSAIRVNVESDSDRDISTITSLRLHFAKTITLMVNSIPLEKRKALLPPDKKQEFMFLFFSWCGGAISQTDRKHARDIGTYVELKAMHALCSMLCCGPATESYSSSVHVKDSILRWIDMIFMSTSQTVQNICEDMLSTVLHLNDQNNALFEFVVDMCYKQPSEFAKRYFKSLVMLFSKREYPCELVSMLVLCQVYAGDNDDIIRQSAAWLIQILRRQFLDDTGAINLSSTLHTSMSMSDESFKGEIFSVTLRSKRAPGIRLFPTSQFFICHQLSQQYPSLTMEMISELFSRLTYLKDISRHIQASILNTLVYWIENIELIDSNCELLNLEEDGISRERGYGNEEATRLILNNLLYITAVLPAEHQNSVGRLWKTLVTKYPSNLNVVIQYIFVAMSLSPDHVIILVKIII